MKLYIDEDSIEARLVQLLLKLGHDVELPSQVGLMGKRDPVQLLHAIRQQRVLVSMNHDDFESLHELIREAAGRHQGIFIVRKDNDPTRDMSPRGIANAIAKYGESGLPLEGEFVVLNQWR